MPVTLTKIVDGKPAVKDTLENEQILQCSLCDEVYRLGYSDNEWTRVKDWLNIAERSIREGHKSKHQAESLHLEWKPMRRKR
jgi:hypothetical protein